MDIHNIVSEVGLELISQGKFAYAGKNLDYFVTNRKVRDIQYPNISKFIIVSLHQEMIEYINSLENHDWFKEFQHNLLSELYFECKSDLRWNMYLLLIVDDYLKIDSIQVNSILNDNDYARKLILTCEDAAEFLNWKNYRKDKNNITSIRSPLDDWIQVLEKVSLTGVLNEKFYKQPILDYVYSNQSYNLDSIIYARESTSQSATRDLDEIRPIHIEKLTMNNYRKHCFGNIKVIEPALVNLVHGPNGSGKSSILEAIEYAVTNRIKRIEDFGGTLEDQSSVTITCNTKNETLSLSSNKVTAYCKRLNQAWYGTPIGVGPCKSFNPNFNKFNNFSAETAYKFALDESQSKNNYSEMFTRLLYDENLIAMEKSWRRNRDMFVEIERELVNKRFYNRNEINEIKDELSKLNADDIDIEQIKKVLREVKYAREVNFDNLYSQIYVLEESFNTLLLLVDDLDLGIHKYNILDINNCKEKIEDSINKANILKQEINLKNKQALPLQDEVRKIIASINTLDLEEVQNRLFLDQINNAGLVWVKVRKIISNQEKVIEYRRLKKRAQELKDKLYILNRVAMKYKEIFELEDINFSEELPTYDSLESRKVIQKDKLKQVENEIKEKYSNVDKIKRLRIQLNNTALLILENQEEKHKCPLCGTKHDTYNDLVKNMDSYLDFISIKEDDLKKLESDKIKIIQEIDKLEGQLNKRKNMDRNIASIKMLIDEINKYNLFEISTENLSNNSLAICNNITMEKDIIANELKKIDELLEYYNKDGYTEENIEHAYVFIKENAQYKSFKQSKNQYTSFEHYLEVIRSNVESKELEIYKKRDKLRENKVFIENKILVDLDTQEIKNELERLELLIEKLKNILHIYNNLKDYFALKLEDDLSAWIDLFYKVKTTIGIEVRKIKVINNISSLEQRLNKAVEYHIQLNNSYERCCIGLQALSSLTELKDYSINFIESNIDKIEYFFKKIHTPKEFSRLQISEGMLIARRNGNGEQVKIFEMSTGQRVSLALSVMFSSYLAATQAPKFLILDEPVANMDDLHLLNLLDILRDFALNGTQIIFTTANPDVAGVFRRKFSFFGEQFKHFEMIRDNDNYTKIRVFKYSPQINEGQLLQEIS